MPIPGSAFRARSPGRPPTPMVAAHSSAWLVTGDGQNKYVGRVLSPLADGAVLDVVKLPSNVTPGEPVTLLFSRPINEEPVPQTIYAVVESLVVRAQKTDTGHQITIRFRSPED